MNVSHAAPPLHLSPQPRLSPQPPLPPGFGLVLDRATRTYRGGTVLAGGRPLRVIRLSGAGRTALGQLLAGDPAGEAARSLGRHLVEAGLAHPRAPEPAGSQPSLTVVVPVRDRPRQLARLLGALGTGSPVVVVDDGSRDRRAVRRIAQARGATVIRHEYALGPAAARNAPLGGFTSELVAFIDSDCVPSPGWADRLASHFADPAVGAVAPRILPLGRARALPSALDMGAAQGPVAPRRGAHYVPSACLVVRRAALGAGFDPQLLVGEDVDLVWRLHDAGWSVRYDPSVVVAHEEPPTLAGLLRRRAWYGSSVAPLAIRHPGRLAHLIASPALAGAAALAIASGARGRSGTRSASTIRGAPPAGWAGPALLLAWDVVRISRGLVRAGVPPAPAARIALRNAADSAAALGRSATMLGWPALLAAACSRRTRGRALALGVGPALYRWSCADVPRGAGPACWTVASVLDDAAYGAGVWRGCLVHRTLAPLLPVIRSGGSGSSR